MLSKYPLTKQKTGTVGSFDLMHLESSSQIVVFVSRIVVHAPLHLRLFAYICRVRGVGNFKAGRYEFVGERLIVLSLRQCFVLTRIVTLPKLQPSGVCAKHVSHNGSQTFLLVMFYVHIALIKPDLICVGLWRQT